MLSVAASRPPETWMDASRQTGAGILHRTASVGKHPRMRPQLECSRHLPQAAAVPALVAGFAPDVLTGVPAKLPQS
jgi:hypothetical protein